jgi:hypothetical protein
MSQSGSSNDITVAIAGCSTPFHSTSTSSWTVSPLIPRPSIKQDNTPTVFPLALGVIRVQWQFATSTVHQQQASGTTRARSTAVTYPSRISLWPTTGWRCIARDRAIVFRSFDMPSGLLGGCRSQLHPVPRFLDWLTLNLIDSGSLINIEGFARTMARRTHHDGIYPVYASHCDYCLTTSGPAIMRIIVISSNCKKV